MGRGLGRLLAGIRRRCLVGPRSAGSLTLERGVLCAKTNMPDLLEVVAIFGSNPAAVPGTALRRAPPTQTDPPFFDLWNSGLSYFFFFWNLSLSYIFSFLEP